MYEWWKHVHYINNNVFGNNPYPSYCEGNSCFYDAFDDSKIVTLYLYTGNEVKK